MEQLSNSIVCGDCIEVMKKEKSCSYQIIIADPPYNIGKNFGNNSDKQKKDDYLKWCNTWINECLRLLTQNGTMFIYGFSETLADISADIPNGIYKRWIIWHYKNKTTPHLNFWQRSHESILVLSKVPKPHFNRDLIREPYSANFLKGSVGKTRTSTKGRFSNGTKETVYTAHQNGALPRDVIEIATLAGGGSERTTHPTQKPLKLCEKLIKSCCVDNCKLLVPFAGSGSELVAAKQLNINYLGIEINKDYIEIIKERLINTVKPTMELPTFLHIDNVKKLKNYKDITFENSQYNKYKDNGASIETLNLISLNSKRFGTEMEKIIIELFNLKPRTTTQHDATYNYKKIEIKCSRYWANGNVIWQHIEPKYDYDVILFVLLDFNSISVYLMNKNELMNCIKNGIVTKQGQQGYWTSYDKIKDKLINIYSLQQLQNELN